MSSKKFMDHDVTASSITEAESKHVRALFGKKNKPPTTAQEPDGAGAAHVEPDASTSDAPATDDIIMEPQESSEPLLGGNDGKRSNPETSDLASKKARTEERSMYIYIYIHMKSWHTKGAIAQKIAHPYCLQATCLSRERRRLGYSLCLQMPFLLIFPVSTSNPPPICSSSACCSSARLL